MRVVTSVTSCPRACARSATSASVIPPPKPIDCACSFTPEDPSSSATQRRSSQSRRTRLVQLVPAAANQHSWCFASARPAPTADRHRQTFHQLSPLQHENRIAQKSQSTRPPLLYSQTAQTSARHPDCILFQPLSTFSLLQRTSRAHNHTPESAPSCSICLSSTLAPPSHPNTSAIGNLGHAGLVQLWVYLLAPRASPAPKISTISPARSAAIHPLRFGIHSMRSDCSMSGMDRCSDCGRSR